MATSAGHEPIRRSLLFVPAVRPDRYPKALATGADAVCLDLEDGVAFGAKETAREQAFALLAGREPTPAEVSLRINDVKTELGRTDLAALIEAGVRPDALMLPKVAGADEIEEVEAALSRAGAPLPLIVQLETAAGVLAADGIAAASSNVSAVFFGAIDLSADLGSAVEWEALLYARSRVVLAAGAAGVSALDTPFMDVPAVAALAEESRRVRRLGFAGKAAIHPSQVPVIQGAFSPSDEELAWARKIVAAYERQQGGVLLVDGKLIERPVVRSAQRSLQIAARLAAGDGSDS
jgi:citrate lyase beta subunit